MRKINNTGLYFGSVDFVGFGGFQEKMLSELLEKDIPLRRCKLSGGTVSGTVSPLNYYTVAKTAAKHGVRIKSGRRRGLYFTLSKYRNRIGLYVGFLMFAAILSFCQTHVADITIEGNVSESEVRSILAECGITKGADKYSLPLYKAEQQLMLSIEDCAWADVSCTGSRVTAHVEKSTPVPEIEDNSSPRNIVASRSAVIVSQTVRKGDAVLGVGSGVQEGGLLVSGTSLDTRLTVNGTDTGHVLFVRADAEIIGEFTETREFFVPYNETLHTADGEETTFKSIVIGDDIYPLYWGNAFVGNAVYSVQTELVNFLGQEMPFKIRTETYTAYRDVDVTRSGDDCVKELRQQKETFEENFYGDYEIVNAVEKFYPEEDGVRLIMEYTLQGDIAKPQPFQTGLSDDYITQQ